MGCNKQKPSLTPAVACRIFEVRREMGLTQTQVAALVGLSNGASIHSAEKGKNAPGPWLFSFVVEAGVRGVHALDLLPPLAHERAYAAIYRRLCDGGRGKEAAA